MQCPPQILAPLLNEQNRLWGNIFIVRYLHIVNLSVTQNKMCTIIISKQDTLNKISTPVLVI